MAFRGGVGGVGASLSGRASRVSELVRFAVREAEGSQGRAPRFRSRKDNRQSVRLIRNGFSIRGSRKLYVAKVGELKVAWLRELPSEPSSVSIIKDAAGRYFASFVVETTDVPLPECDAEVGIDLGLAAFAVLSDGKVIESPRFFPRAERNLRKAQHEPGESPNQGCESSREGGRSPQRVGAHAVHDTDSRESSGVCRGFVCRGPRTDEVGEVRARCRVGDVHPVVGGESRPVRKAFLEGRPVVPVVADVFGVWTRGREEVVVGAGMDVPVWGGP
ncbi:hypothetical protein EV641_102223 [Rhodococcus sp. SMB37]|nr:hypothetical protein EV641_102223 [Rhodococcus sp. SMB37]